jgi:NitT/TauT family transport system permease protein
MMSRARNFAPKTLFTAGSLIAAVIIWQLIAVIGQLKSYVLPKPLEVWKTIVLRSDLLWSNTWVTLQEIVIGFVLAILLGIPTALVIARFSVLDNLLSPLLVGLQIVPKIAIAPLFVVWFGFGTMPKILMTLLISFFPILINSLSGFASESPAMKDLAKIAGLSGWTHFRRIQLPNALPMIFSGLKVGVTFAVIGAIVGEFVGASEGLGYVLVLANGNLDTALIFASLVYITVLGLVLYALVALAERLSTPWHVSFRER